MVVFFVLSFFLASRMATCRIGNLCLLQAGYPIKLHSPGISLSTSSMHTDFALDIKVHRRKAGLSQKDVAHLIGVHPSKVSLMEAGKMLPSIWDIAHLSLVYGKSFEEFFFSFVSKARESIRQRLPSMPEAPKRWLGRFNRQYTVDQIAERLAASKPDREAA